MKYRMVSLAVAAILSVGLSVGLELSPKGIAAVTTICLLICLGIAEIINAFRSGRP